MNNDSLRKEIAINAKKVVEENFNQEHSFQKIEELFLNQINRFDLEWVIRPDAHYLSNYYEYLTQLNKKDFVPINLKPLPSDNLIRLKKIYKIITGKRPLNILWKKK